MKICKVKGCHNRVLAKGYCNKHYLKLKRNGSPEKKKYQKRGNQCSVEGCAEKVYAKNLCHKHWQRLRKYETTDRKMIQQPWRGKETKEEYLTRNSKVNKKMGCIEWISNVANDGYGQGWYQGRPIRAHRLSYLIHIGEIPEGKIVCHHCDNPRCINPDHLYVGTHKDNARDREERGRSNIKTGEDSHSAKLTEKQAIEIIKRRKNGEKKESIAKDYGISHWTVGDIVKGNSWKNIDRKSIQGECVKDSIGRIKNTKTKLTERQVKKIKYDLTQGDKSLKDLAKEFCVDRKLIADIRDDLIWNHIQTPEQNPYRRIRKQNQKFDKEINNLVN